MKLKDTRSKVKTQGCIPNWIKRSLSVNGSSYSEVTSLAVEYECDVGFLVCLEDHIPEAIIHNSAVFVSVRSFFNESLAFSNKSSSIEWRS